MRRFWRIVVVAIASHTALAFAQDPSSAVAQGFSPVAVSRDELWKRCKNPDEDIRIAGCTALIQSAAETPSDEALARHNRATAYRNKREYELALRDLDEAIALDPKFVDAVGDRGITLTALGRFADAIPDFTQSLGVFFQPVHTMTGIIAQEMGEVVRGSIHYRALFMVGLVLFGLTLLINLAAQKVVARYRMSIG